MLLGVNIDHVATLRNARGTTYPSPLEAALLAETHAQAAAWRATPLPTDRAGLTELDRKSVV